jgi:hypothetical protein
MIARRKALESELAKELYSADKLDPTSGIKDRFGIRFIVLNDEEAIYIANLLTKSIIDILCSLNRKSRNQFIEHVNNSSKIDEFSKERTMKLLSIPFEMEPFLKPKNTTGFKKEEYDGRIDFPTEEENLLLKQYEPHIKNYFANPKENGYQSLHFILKVGAVSDENLENACFCRK